MRLIGVRHIRENTYRPLNNPPILGHTAFCNGKERDLKVGLNIQKQTIVHSVLPICLCGALFFYLLETALPDVWGIAPSQILLVGAVGVAWWQKKESAGFFRQEPASVWLLLYGLVFLLTGLKSGWTPALWQPLITAGQMGLLLILVVRTNEVDSLLLRMPVGAGVVAFSMGITLWVMDQSPYRLRISPIQDYNQYAMVLLIGLVALWSRPVWKEKACLFSWESAVAVWLLAGVWLSGSRRGLLFSFFIILGHWVMDVQSLLCLPKSRVRWKGLLHDGIRQLLILALSGLLFFAGNTFLSSQEKVPLLENGQNENTLTTTMESLPDGQAAHKRLLIWKAAIKAYWNSSLWEKAVGQGADYPQALYDETWGEEVRESYGSLVLPAGSLNPHNFLLTELLAGGMVRLIAAFVLWFSLIRHAWQSVKKGRLFLVLLWGIVGGTLCLSAPVGFIGSRLFWIAWILTWGWQKSSERQKE